MNIKIEEFVARLAQEAVLFSETMKIIDQFYDYHPVAFRNGLGDDVVDNPAGTNEGSCKVFAFALLNNLTDEATLACFGEHYAAVLNNPEGDDHKNIRNFMKYGWRGIEFDDMPLRPKAH